MSYSTYTDRHNAVASWFLGPRGENFEYLAKLFELALKTQMVGRQSYFPEDQPFITKDMQVSSQFQDGIKQLENAVAYISEELTKHSVPFWNPRYNGHMLMDTTLPGIAGYITTMLFNPNNVAAEASPLTTTLERHAGEQLCEMIGIEIGIDVKKGWGHITCGGSIANLESIWAVRNMKFYPLSLTLAMENGPLDFIRNDFKLTTCDGTEKLFSDFTTWELLNLTPDVILDIPDRLYQQYLISPSFLQKSMQNYTVQTTPRDNPMFVQRFERDGIQLNDMALVTSATKHYSWPKGAAITGIGSSNIISVKVDFDARMDINDLRRTLEECLNTKRAIYAVVAIMGSTEHGACDPLKEIVELRTEFQSKGLSFALHADGAWGAYYHTMLNPPPHMSTGDSSKVKGYVPSMPLKPATADGLRHLRYCETITIDPHKSGYIQYPAGGLLYRDGRMRYLVTWASPVVFRSNEESMGVYGVEGSKPGASPVAVWLSNQVIGLHQHGYGAILGEGVFGAVKMYAHLATMSTPSTDFRVTTLNMLPAEALGGDVEAQKDFIRQRILNIDNATLVKDTEAMDLVKEMGSDLSINAFAVNFRVNGEINEDIIEANILNKRIFERLAITGGEDVNTRPLILTSTQLSQSAYGSCLTKFKERLGLVGDQDLYVLINVVSSPFPTDGNFTATIASALREIISQEVAIAQRRNTVKPSIHGFIMQGLTRIYATHIPMFSMAEHRYQLIITGDLPPDVAEKYIAERKKNPGQFFVIANANDAVLTDMVRDGQFEADIDMGIPTGKQPHLISGFSLTNVRVIIQRPLDSKYLTEYPKTTMPFFVYGDKEANEWHVDHAILASPNIQLTSESVNLDSEMTSHLTSVTDHLILHAHVPEAAMQPFPSNEKIAKIRSKFFFRPGAELKVTLARTIEMKPEDVLAHGTLQLSDTVYIDTDLVNMDPEDEKHEGGHAHEVEESTDADESEEAEGGGGGYGYGKGESNGTEDEKKDSEIEVPEPILRSAFDQYVKNETKEDQSIPLLQNIQESIGELFLQGLKNAIAGES